MSEVQNTEGWRERLAEALKASGTSKRKASLEAGLGAGAVHSWLSEGKDPSIDNLLAVCSVLGVSLSFIAYGYNVSPETEEIMALIEGNPGAREGILALLRSRSGS